MNRTGRRHINFFLFSYKALAGFWRDSVMDALDLSD